MPLAFLCYYLGDEAPPAVPAWLAFFYFFFPTQKAIDLARELVTERLRRPKPRRRSDGRRYLARHQKVPKPRQISLCRFAATNARLTLLFGSVLRGRVLLCARDGNQSTWEGAVKKKKKGKKGGLHFALLHKRVYFPPAALPRGVAAMIDTAGGERAPGRVMHKR